MQPRVGLFVTCLIDVVRPSVGFAAARLIEAAGGVVHVARQQTCCGQPAYNSGDRATSKALAQQTMRAFEACDAIVAPSGSCAAMLKVHYPRLFAGDGAAVQADVAAFSARVHELCSYLADDRRVTDVPGRFAGTLTIQDSCSGLRELGIKSAPRRLLGLMPAAKIIEMKDPEACCGFGGLFAEKYPGISNAIVGRKTDDAAASQAGLIVGGDLGCLMNMAGKLKRAGSPLACRHIAEVLAGELNDPPIGHPQGGVA